MFNIEHIQLINKLKSLTDTLHLKYQIFDDDISKIYIIHKDNLPIAIIQFTNFLLIEWFEVFPEYRRQGYGKRIINFLLSQYKLNTHSCSVFVTPLDENVKQFWLKCGFVISEHSPQMEYRICKNTF